MTQFTMTKISVFFTDVTFFSEIFINEFPRFCINPTGLIIPKTPLINSSPTDSQIKEFFKAANWINKITRLIISILMYFCRKKSIKISLFLSLAALFFVSYFSNFLSRIILTLICGCFSGGEF